MTDWELTRFDFVNMKYICIMIKLIDVYFSNILQDKTVSIPDRSKEWKPGEAPEFVRFVMGKLKASNLNWTVERLSFSLKKAR